MKFDFEKPLAVYVMQDVKLFRLEWRDSNETAWVEADTHRLIAACVNHRDIKVNGILWNRIAAYVKSNDFNKFCKPH